MLGIDAVHLPGRPAQLVVDKHRERLAKVGDARIRRLDERLVAETVQEVVMRVQRVLRDRGVLVPLSADEINAIDNRKTQSDIAG